MDESHLKMLVFWLVFLRTQFLAAENVTTQNEHQINSTTETSNAEQSLTINLDVAQTQVINRFSTDMFFVSRKFQ